MNTTFEASIGQLLGEAQRERIVVPEFQRGYEWEKKHVEAFWKDIVELQAERELKHGRKRHFLGPIVVLQRDNDVWELLDGQQRLATTTILFCAIRDASSEIRTAEGTQFAVDTHNNYILKGKEHMSLTLGETDESHFRETVQSMPVVKRHPLLRTNRNIDSARKLLKAKVEEALGNNSTPSTKIAFLRELRRTVISDLSVACIPVQDEREAFKIFETLNDRGLRLAAPDLLFNMLMQKADKADRKVMRSLWTEIIEDLGHYDLKDFLRAYWVSKHGDIKKTDLFSILRVEVENGTIQPLPFIRECSSEVASYVSIVDASPQRLKKASGPVKSMVSELNTDVPIPLLLSAMKRIDLETTTHFEKLCRWILVFIVRYSVLGGLDRAGIEDILYAQARELRAATNPGLYLNKILETYKSNSPPNDLIDPDKILLNNTSARYVMPKIAAYMQSRGNEWKAGDSVNIEHIYPKNPNPKEWGGQEEQAILDDLVWHIGNLTVLSSKLNSKASNAEFKIKVTEYKKTSVEMTKRLLSDYKKWDKDQILNRGRNMANLAKQIWRYEDLSKV